MLGTISAIVTPNGQGGLNAGPILGLDKKHCSVGSDNMLAFYLLVLVILIWSYNYTRCYFSCSIALHQKG